MLSKSIVIVLFAMAGNLARADALPMDDATRGDLLYSTYCIACHDVQVHWRDKKLATDLARLRAQVFHWQKFSGLAWSNADIAAVSRYLNDLYYHYPASD